MKSNFTKAVCLMAAMCLFSGNVLVAKADVTTVSTETESTLVSTPKTLVSGKVFIGSEEKYISKNALTVAFKTTSVNGNAQINGVGADIPFTYDVVNGTGTITDGGVHNFTKADMITDSTEVVKINTNSKVYHTKAEHNLKSAMETKEVKLNSDFLTGKSTNDNVAVGDTIRHLGSDYLVKEMKAEVIVGAASNDVNLPNTHTVVTINGWKDNVDVKVKYTIKLEAKPITEKTISISTDNDIWNYKGAGSWKELAIINGGTKTVLKKGQKYNIKFANPDKMQVVVSNGNSNINFWNGEIKFDGANIQLKPETSNSANNVWYTPNNTEKNFYGYVQQDYKVGFKTDGSGLKFQEVLKKTGQDADIVDTNYYTYDVQAKDSTGAVIKGITIKDSILNSLVGYDYPLIQQNSVVKWGDGNQWTPFMNGSNQKYLGELILKTDSNGFAKPVVQAKASYGGSSDREYSVSLHGDIRQDYKSESYGGQSKAILNLNNSFVNPNSTVNVYTDLQPKTDNVLGSYYDIITIRPFGKSIQVLDVAGNKIADVSMGVRTSKDTAPIQNTQYMLLGNKNNQRKSTVDSQITYAGNAAKDWEIKVDYAEGNNNDQNFNTGNINYYGQPYNQNGQAYTPKYNLNAPTAIFHISVVKKTPQEVKEEAKTTTDSSVKDDSTTNNVTKKRKSKKSKKNNETTESHDASAPEVTDDNSSSTDKQVVDDNANIDDDSNPNGNADVEVNERSTNKTSRKYQPAEPRTGEGESSHMFVYCIISLAVLLSGTGFVLYKKGKLSRFIK